MTALPAVYPGPRLGGDPTYHGFTLGETLTEGEFTKADYPGFRAIRVDGVLILADDVTDPYPVPEPVDPVGDYRPEMVAGRAVQTTAQPIGTVPTNVIAVTLNIPAHWGSGYDVEAVSGGTVNDTSGGSAATSVVVTGQMVHQAGNFQTSVPWELMDLNYHDIHPFEQVSYVEGLTNTGSRTFTWQMTRAATFACSADQLTLIVHAYHTPAAVPVGGGLEVWY